MPEAAGNLCFAHTQNRPQHLSGLSGSTVMRQSCADTLAPEEPDAFITHVRVCGGGRLGNHRLYPEADTFSLRLSARLTAGVRRLQRERKKAKKNLTDV